MTTSYFFWLAVFIFGTLSWAVIVYNRFVSLRNISDNIWQQTDVQLNRRYDLVPELIASVKASAPQQPEVFERANQARTAAMNARGTRERTQAETNLTQAIQAIFTVAETHPELTADPEFQSLRSKLME